jgi:hypothetical protein
LVGAYHTPCDFNRAQRRLIASRAEFFRACGGEGAAELVHLGQLAMIGNLSVDTFVDGIFNVPTLAEVYRVAALDLVRQRSSPVTPPA